MAATPERRDGDRDPVEEQRERARHSVTGTQLPSEAGLGNGAGETPIADVEADSDPDDVPNHPSLGAPPRRDESRPVFRSSQLEKGDGDEEPKLRG